MRHVAALAFALLLATQANGMGNYRWHDADDSSPPSVPEPAAIGLFASGSAIIGWAIHRRRK
jgi:PEP-CTERM motif-containing protein